MVTAEATVWAMHAGQAGEAEPLFLQKHLLAIGWKDFGDAHTLPPDRDAFKKHYMQCYPGSKPMSVAISAGIIYRFVHEMKPGDVVVYPSKQTRQIHIGHTTEPYEYNPSLAPDYPHQRAVTWDRVAKREQFSQGALYEIGSAMSLFLVKTYADEFLTALHGKPPPIAPVEEDVTVALVSEEIEQNTRDFILKRLAQELKGHPLQDFVAHLLGTMGYRTRIGPLGTDGGIDIVAHRDELGFEPPIIKVQVKSSAGNIGNPEVAALYGNVGPNEFGLLVTLGSFTPPAKAFARGKSNLRLVDGNELVDLILEHYEQFDSRYKGLLPLKKIYVPEPLADAGE